MDSYCTVFDSNYLSRGLALYNSLVDTGDAFQLWVLATDEQCAKSLDGLGWANLKVVKLSEFETPELLAVKAGRSRQEYNWTCTPLFIRHCLWSDPGADMWTYVDPDVMFFASPRILLDEMGDASILLTKHRFAPVYDQEAAVGAYCVHFNTFRRTAEGLAALTWWCERCLEWCFARHEDGRFGDQKYLDDWTERFAGVHVASHAGAGLGPWNVDAYRLERCGGQVRVERDGIGSGSLVFYHFHGLRFISDKKINLASGYRLSPNAVDLIYEPYIRSLVHSAASVANAPNPHGIQRKSIRTAVSLLRQQLFYGVRLHRL